MRDVICLHLYISTSTITCSSTIILTSAVSREQVTGRNVAFGSRTVAFFFPMAGAEVFIDGVVDYLGSLTFKSLCEMKWRNMLHETLELVSQLIPIKGP